MGKKTIFCDEYGIRDGWIATFYILTVLVFIIGFIITPIIISDNLTATASEKADFKCKSLGFDTYETFNRKFLDTTPLGVKCNHIANKKEVIGVETAIALL